MSRNWQLGARLSLGRSGRSSCIRHNDSLWRKTSTARLRSPAPRAPARRSWHCTGRRISPDANPGRAGAAGDVLRRARERTPGEAATADWSPNHAWVSSIEVLSMDAIGFAALQVEHSVQTVDREPDADPQAAGRRFEDVRRTSSSQFDSYGREWEQVVDAWQLVHGKSTGTSTGSAAGRDYVNRSERLLWSIFEQCACRACAQVGRSQKRRMFKSLPKHYADGAAPPFRLRRGRRGSGRQRRAAPLPCRPRGQATQRPLLRG